MIKKAFTLTEMLVTISITSLVMAVMMPAFARSRAEGRSIVCTSNLRQLVVAVQSYACDNDDYYPIAYVRDPNPEDSLAVYNYWDFAYTKNGDTGEVKIKPGLLWRGQTNSKIQQCPSFKGNANSSDPYTGYNYNTSFIGHGSNEALVKPARISQVRKPAQCAIFGDGEYIDGANKFMRAPFKTSTTYFAFQTAGTQGYRHSGATNVAWCDGHASSQKELYTDTDESGGKEKLEQYNQTAKVKVGFLSPDNSAYDLE